MRTRYVLECPSLSFGHHEPGILPYVLLIHVKVLSYRSYGLDGLVYEPLLRREGPASPTRLHIFRMCRSKVRVFMHSPGVCTSHPLRRVGTLVSETETEI